MALDLKDKKMQELAKFLHEKKFLVVEASATSRTTIKKVLLGLGIDHKFVFVADSIKNAEPILNVERPEFVCTHVEASETCLASFYQKHYELSPNRNKSGFGIIANKENTEVSNFILDHEVDFVLNPPYTTEGIEQLIVSSLSQKLFASPYKIKVEEGREFFQNKDYEKAEEVFTEAQGLDENSYLASYFLGQIAFDLKKFNEARFYFEKALSLQGDHYLSLKRLAQSLFELKEYEQAYSLYVKLIEQFPFNSNRIPKLIRLAILTQHYHDLLSYGKMFSAMKNKIPRETSRCLAAGLAICGKKLLSDSALERQALGGEALHLALSLSCGKKEILESIMQTFIGAGKADEALELLQDFSDENLSPEDYLLLQFDVLNEASQDPMPVLALGNSLMSKQIKTQKIFQVMIERSIQAKRAQNAIEILIQEARKLFPEESQTWERWLGTE